MIPDSGRFEFDATGRRRVVSGPTPVKEVVFFVQLADNGVVYAGSVEASDATDDQAGAPLYTGDQMKITAEPGTTIDLYDWWFSGQLGDVITWLALK